MPLRAILLGGTRCSGNSIGTSWPSSLMFTRCIASANSSASSIPSRSMSESFQIFPRIVFGSLDLTSSDLADAPVILPLIGFRFYTRQPITQHSVRTVLRMDKWMNSVCLSVCLSHRHTGQFFLGRLSHLCPENFSTAPEKTAMLTCKITLPDSPHPVIISKNPGFRALYLARWNEFRFFV